MTDLRGPQDPAPDALPPGAELVQEQPYPDGLLWRIWRLPNDTYRYRVYGPQGLVYASDLDYPTITKARTRARQRVGKLRR